MDSSKLSQLLDLLWNDYVKTNPPAQKIHDLFTAEGETVVNDHIAFRTYNHPAVNIDVVAQVFTDLGYVPKGDYHFKKKKLYAKHYEHSDPLMPLIFISELKLQEFNDEVNDIVKGFIEQIPRGFTDDKKFVYSGRPWQLSFETYKKLKSYSEYAAWMAAFGFRVNHFTVSINHLKKFNEIQSVNQFLKDHGFELNTSGGEVKGTPDEYLEQSSTIAYNKEVSFEDGSHIIPACYYEFAKRYKTPDGKLFRGFIAGSADKIFESTDKGQSM